LLPEFKFVCYIIQCNGAEKVDSKNETLYIFLKKINVYIQEIYFLLLRN